MEFDQSSALCHIFTYKEGLLSGLGHDLRITVDSFRGEVDGDAGTIRARFDARSLHVDCAMKEGRERPDMLTSDDKKEIDEIILRKVLEADTYQDIVMESSSVTKEETSYKIDASLTLHGRTREIFFLVRKKDGRYIADFRLHLPDFGIQPFSALFGMLKIKPDILVRVITPGMDEKGLSFIPEGPQ